MLKVNKSLRVLQLPGLVSDCIPIFEGLAKNETIEGLIINERTKKSAMKYSYYPLIRRKIIFRKLEYNMFRPLY